MSRKYQHARVDSASDFCLEQQLEETSKFSNAQSKAAPNMLNTTLKSQDTSNIRGKISSLEDSLRAMADELSIHKKEVSVLRGEKETLESVITLKTQEVRKTLTNENFKVEEEMKRHYAHQKNENSRLQQQITALRGEKTALDMQLIELERRMAEVEINVGHAE